ncbi:recombinase family protein [Caulobacter endophyticus]|uniref:recombinase family protein n=1 Tax=Caulobacter endophyticus TaxID=2172652 RepID=UPI00240F0ADC|nr:recombinase family protein [Caulobacter endophyticus]MDG2531020.1 recombinase family protein [Caulobacter endophyticus]
MQRFVAYYRVSTKRQGDSGLGLDAQRDAVRGFVAGRAVVAEFEEVESGKKADRPALEAALRACRLHGATLVIAKLDRLSRSVTFISKLMDEGVQFVACDLPHANALTVGIMASVAQFEREMISTRTRQALAAARARGVVLGGRRGDHRIEDYGEAGRQRSARVRRVAADATAGDCLIAIEDVRKEGAQSLRGVAAALNARRIPAPRGGEWSAGQVRRVIMRTSGGGLG